MKRNRVVSRGLPGTFLLVMIAISAFAGIAAEDFDALINAGENRIQLAQASQDRIDEVVQETRDLEGRYRQLLKESDGLEVYNEYMERQVANQETELAQFRSSIDQVSDVERQIMPLMVRMLDGLERFIELDIPFLYEERVGRVAGLNALMERADVSVAEKFRRITEAFQIENDFGRTIETYLGTLVIDGATLEVSFLRLGRIGLYYQTSDASVTGRWSAQAEDWEVLAGSEARNQVRQGLRIARKQVAPDLLLLPIDAPEAPR